MAKQPDSRPKPHAEPIVQFTLRFPASLYDSIEQARQSEPFRVSLNSYFQQRMEDSIKRRPRLADPVLDGPPVDPRDLEIARLRERIRLIDADEAYKGWMTP